MDIKQMIYEFRERHGWNESDTIPALAKSIVIEAAELLECFQFDEEHFDMDSVEQELADVLIYTLSMAYDLGLKPEEIIERKIHIVDERSK